MEIVLHWWLLPIIIVIIGFIIGGKLINDSKGQFDFTPIVGGLIILATVLIVIALVVGKLFL